jgi:anti-anti-sigma factor
MENSMDITTIEENGVCIASLDGKFDTASSVPAESELMALLDQGKNRLVLDFTDVAYIASSGLRVLLKLAQRLKTEGGELRLCSVNETVGEVFRISGFDKILDVRDSRQQALENAGG